ncbi:MAG: protocatechuate 3,4-dioxygenase subunit alpha [Segniliparus sp.]|uniref:protocatechuate 3,4-dioxygenase subunit alpha n=1 Tax=Segniliparus sp. TaxID=2804064 RepID=UPI003F2F6D20
MPELIPYAPTPGQTVGPFYGYALPIPGAQHLVGSGLPGSIRLTGTVVDGAGDPIPDCLLEIFQPAADGSLAAPSAIIARADHDLLTPLRDPTEFAGWGRCATTGAGRYAFTTVRPGGQPGTAPFIAVAVFARGLLDVLFSRIYLPTDAPPTDALLESLPEDRRSTLVATKIGADAYEWNVCLQGERETVFLAHRGRR